MKVSISVMLEETPSYGSRSVTDVSYGRSVTDVSALQSEETIKQKLFDAYTAAQKAAHSATAAQVNVNIHRG